MYNSEQHDQNLLPLAGVVRGTAMTELHKYFTNGNKLPYMSIFVFN